MADEHRCEKCGRSFDSERGLSVHQSQMHGEDAEPRESNTAENTEPEAGEETFETVDVSLPVRNALWVVFILGIVVGFAGGLTLSTLTPGNGQNSGSDVSITEKVEGVDASKIASMMEKNRQSYLQEISEDRQEGQNAGITGTPGFVIYRTGSETGTRLVGAHPYSNFQDVIENVLQGNASGNVSIDFETKNEPSVGSKDAPVTMVYWFDYQCPFCNRFEQNTLPRIMENYVKTGKVRIIFKDFPFLGQDSRTAAIASKSVWNAYPERWFEWHKTVFENQGRENSGWASKENLVG